MMRSLVQLVCILLLLVAQQGALTHAVWHAGDRHEPPARQAHDGHGHDQAPAKLCDFHAALGTVLGAVGSDHAPLLADRANSTLRAAIPHSRTTTDPVPAVSRGPPALS